LWPSTTAPTTASDADTNAVEVGVQFTSDVAGTVTGLSFYKGSGNTGTHVGHLWDANGNLLATVTFTNETASGWQTASFSNPVAISANTTYVISYYAPNGQYAADGGYFNSGFDSGHLHVAAGGGVYAYGSSGTFPTLNYQNTNYWVEPIVSVLA
jgi:hypothetical protein